MPFLNGRRVSLEEWRAAHPVGPLYLRDDDGNRTRIYAGDIETIDPAAAIARVRATMQEAQSAVRAAAIAEALGVSPDDPVMADIDVTAPELQHSYSLTPATHEPTELPEPLRAPEEPATAPRRAVEGSSRPSEHHATRFSARHGLPRHRKTRRSQSPAGRRERYLREKAERLGLSPAEVARNTLRYQPRKPRTMS